MPRDGARSEASGARPLATLSAAERLVVGSLRRYAAEGRRGDALAPIFRDVFGLSGVEGALDAFAAFVALLERYRRGGAEGRVPRDRLSAVEDCVLRLLTAIQDGDDIEADAVTTWLVVNMGAAPLRQAARRLVGCLDEAGQRLGAVDDDPTPRAPQPSVDRVSDLTPDERLLLSGIRAWVGRIKQDECGWPALHAIFAARGAGPAAAGLHAMLYNLSIATRRPIDVRCSACRSLSPDEARMLHAIACAQAGRTGDSFDLLLTWLPPAAARLTVEAVEGAARFLRQAQAALLLRRWDFARLESLAEPPPSRPATSHVLH